MSILWSLLVFSLLILAHELGHFLVAKRVGIRVEEFALGMGPVIARVKRGETVYSLRAFPLGGFNRMAGMEEKDADDPRGFNRQPVTARMAVIAAGSGMNFLLAIFLFIFVFMVIGLPVDKNIVGRVEPGRPAALAGIKPGDKIVAIEGVAVNSWSDIVQEIYRRPEQDITLEIERQGERLKVVVRSERDPHSGVGLIGIGPSWERQGLLKSVRLGFSQAVAVTGMILMSLIEMITGKTAPEIVGPVGIVQLVSQAASFGWINVLNFTAVLSLDLGLINLLPIPALDGSRLTFLIWEGLRGRPIDPAKENFIHLIGFALLMGLLLLITYQDLVRLLG
ncbi:site-2 protease. Metallo peptidase. MEROPS family M50B [Thermanaeromonas toyohensis ToBE]|uniref:Zinc metalloprotease n=1 Tax=Thermanaeromonas toyohensis ToBE TaxID=698762 RepID=A0A1W1VQ89_9FIRM|nr:RIP metalloprotease RseP [Thermanaeromonas toyohensis]SMB95519.1 site-2 protease. Metallo peptidase. MEROPS family M50B [Thermanaeromonas toyohensis ToBE]